MQAIMNQLLRAEVAKGFAPKFAMYDNAGECVPARREDTFC
jgi:hypothetical protein